MILNDLRLTWQGCDINLCAPGLRRSRATGIVPSSTSTGSAVGTQSRPDHIEE